MSQDRDEEYWSQRMRQAYLDEVGDLESIMSKSELELRKVAEFIARRLGSSLERVLDALRRIGASM